MIPTLVSPEVIAAEVQAVVGQLLQGKARLYRAMAAGDDEAKRDGHDLLETQVALEERLPTVTEALDRLKSGEGGAADVATVGAFFLYAELHLSRVESFEARAGGTTSLRGPALLGLGIVAAAIALRVVTFPFRVLRA